MFLPEGLLWAPFAAENNQIMLSKRLFHKTGERKKFDIMMTNFIPNRNFMWLNSLYSLMYRNTYHVTFFTLPSTFRYHDYNFLSQTVISSGAHSSPLPIVFKPCRSFADRDLVDRECKRILLIVIFVDLDPRGSSNRRSRVDRDLVLRDLDRDL